MKQNNISYLLRNNRIFESFEPLTDYAQQLHISGIINDITRLQSTYTYMLHYASKGMLDPESEAIRKEINAELTELYHQLKVVDDAYTEKLPIAKYITENEQEPISMSQLRNELESIIAEVGAIHLLQKNPEKKYHATKPLLEKHTTIVDKLFIWSWANVHWTDSDLNEARDLMSSSIVPTSDLRLFIAGITMGNLVVYDSRKLRFMLYEFLYNKTIDETVRIFLAVGIFFTLMICTNLFSSNRDIRNLLKELNKNKAYKQIIAQVFTHYALSWKTEEIQRIMNEEIIPTIIKGQTDLSNSNIRIIDIDSIMDENPEWMNSFKEVQDKIQQMAKLQSEGYDTQAGTFSQLKNGIYFKHPAHWLTDFNELQPEVARFLFEFGNDEYKKVRELLLSPLFCDSDKFSILSMLTDFPSQQREMLIRQFINNNQLPDNINQLSNKQSYTFLINHYIQNIYRFIRYSRYMKNFNQLFDEDITNEVSRYVVLQSLNRPILLGIAAIFVKNNRFQDAINIYDYLGNLEADDLQKLGYCLEKEEDYPGAIEAYEKAHLAKPGQKWLIRRLINLYIRETDTESAIDLLEEFEELSPNDPFIDFERGEAYMANEEYEQALEYFFKALYFAQSTDKIHRAIAWCYFKLDRYDESINYYKKIEGSNIQVTDYINLGHNYLFKYEINNAIDFYVKAYKLFDKKEDFLNFIDSEFEEFDHEKFKGDLLTIIPDMILLKSQQS